MSRDIPLVELHRRRVLQGLGLAGAGAGALLGTQGVGADDRDKDEETESDVDLEGAYGGGEYTLPELPYDYDALEPAIDARIMELHHSAHHQGYVDGTNAALDELEGMREADDYEGIKRAKRDLSFNLSGHVNHAIFWENMDPEGGGEPEGKLCDRLIEDFGSVSAFREEFSAAAEAVESNGWAWLFYEPLADQLIVGQVESQNRLEHQDATPLLGLDVWEHAYYLQYENRRGEYVDSWWDVVDWDDVAQRYEAALSYW
ncbi:superoxide dismutase [Halalkalicoccus tibetensis]|uniref:Superoxide dismutase n=1 Tax=Halalkalicoccus tibetensis TaxID=175632 RepID=A0ABD5V648_9EURY